MASSIRALRRISLNERIMSSVYLSGWSGLRLLPGRGTAKSTRARCRARAEATGVRTLHFADVRCLKTLRAAGHFELDPVTFGQGLETLSLDGAIVNEDILATFLRDEPVTLCVVEPLHLSLCHSF